VTAPPKRLAVGEVAPGFQLADTDGRFLEFAPGQAPATVVVFTANGCPFARAWHDRIQQVARDYAEAGVRVLQIVSNDDTHHPEDSAASMRARVDAGQLAGPFLHDIDQSAAQAYGATATPEVFVVDRGGVVRYHGAPDADHDDPSQRASWLRDALEAVLAGRAVDRPETSPAGCSMKWRAELLWWEGCPTHEQAADLLRATLTQLGREDVHVVERQVRTPDEARRLEFTGSPTFAVGRHDLFPSDAAPALACRVYVRPDGRVSPLPDATDLADRLREALARPWDLPGWVDPRRHATA
jgi:peroxiredoxin